MPPGADIRQNLALVRGRLEAAARRSGRPSEDITLIAVSKTFDADAVRAAVEAGQRVFGENRVQEALDKMQEVAGDVDWHLIGHVQSNKAKRAVGFACLHAIDSVELMSRIDAAAAEAGRTPRVLVQVDLADEPTKYGAPIPAVRQVVAAGLACRAVRLVGLMAIPPIPTDPEDSRPWFRRLREVRDRLVGDGVPSEALRELSMGMSTDFEIAIDEGATMVRVGTAIFGSRPART